MYKIASLLLLIPILSGCVIKDNFSLLAALANEATITAEAKPDYYYVTKVVDGDTIDVKINGRVERVRLIGINTPESVDPHRPVECYGPESAKEASALLDNKLVKLASDPTQTDRDKFGRLLRYVTTEAGLDYNLEIIKRGFAFEYTYKNHYKFQAQYKVAQLEAQKNKIGLWADSTCGKKYTAKSITTNCLIKGNVSGRGIKAYYLPTCKDYAKIVINKRRGEHLFCTENEAKSAGFKKTVNCN